MSVIHTPAGDKLSYDSEEIDLRLSLMGQFSNPNLLDNPFFTVNQRGASSYTASGYGVDRWRQNTNAATVSVLSDYGVNIASSAAGVFMQIIDPEMLKSIAGKTVVFSAIFANHSSPKSGEVIRFNINGNLVASVNITGNGLYSTVTTIPSNATSMQVQIVYASGSSYDVKCAKLELGSASTLENDSAPNYTAELLKCQRYAQLVGAGLTTTQGNNGKLYLTTKFTVPMRTAPSVSILAKTVNFYGMEIGGGNVLNFDTGSLVSAGGGYTKEGIGYISLGTRSEFTNGNLYTCNTNFILASADL